MAIFLFIGRFAALKIAPMKVEQLLVQYLYKNKTVSIQDIGTFTISPETIIPMEGDKDTSLPEGTIHFSFDKKTPADEGLINYIVEQSGKIRPLASSDLESYTILTRQFLNIGKPLQIEGLGVLQKNQQGAYDFIQGNNITARAEAPHTAVREKIQEEISFSSPAKKTSSKKGWMVAALTIFLLSTAAAVYYFVTREKESPVTQQVTQPTDSLNLGDSIPAAVRDSLLKKDSAIVRTTPANDGYSFKIVIKQYSTKAAAEKAYQKLSNYGHKLLLSPVDSVNYKVSMPFTAPLADTLRAKDSLRKFFGGKPYVEL